MSKAGDTVENPVTGERIVVRLGTEVRDRNGLAYYATSSLAGGIENSVWSARAGVDPSNIGRALEE